ncbi:ATP-binding cassette subfamily C member 8 [Tanacetum coccineum]
MVGARSIMVDENRGREESRQGNTRSRGASRESHQHLEELGFEFAKLREDFKIALNVLGGNLGHEIRDLRGVNVMDDASKIKMVSRYLKDTTALWWRRRYGYIDRGTATIDTWAEFEYVKEFTTRVLEILKLSDQEYLFYFLDVLQGWAKTDMRRDSSKLKDRKVNHEKGGGEKNAQPKVDNARKTPIERIKTLRRVTSMVDASYVMDLIEPEIARRKQASTRSTINGVKAVNLKANPIHGVAKDVRAKIGEWEGTIDLSVVLMDDFKVVLGLEFLDKVRAFPMLFANSLCILDGGKTCIVSTECDAKSGAKPFGHAIQERIQQVLDEFKDVMPKELLKKLPPIREVDHIIELETDYRALNKVTIKNKYPILLTADLFDQLGKARYFTKLDLRLGYYQVWIAEGDEAKTTCVISVVPEFEEGCIEEPVLRLPDVTIPFELHTYALDFSIRGVRMQDEHPIAFKSQKINKTKRKYTVQEKDMTAVIHSLRI